MRKTTKIIILIFLSMFIVDINNYTVDNSIFKSSISNSIEYAVKKVDDKIISKSKKIIKVITSFDYIHSATWYNLNGHYTASGEKFYKDSLTAAYNNSEFGTYLKVTNIDNNESVVVKVTDRMGNKSPNIIDLSLSAFDSISNLSTGRLRVKIEKIKKTTQLSGFFIIQR